MRAARTAVTGAENKGRVDGAAKAADKGIITKKRWIATHDSRTRNWHAELDGVRVDPDEDFVNSIGRIEYPGDLTADGANVWNCRCTLAHDVVGFKGINGKVVMLDDVEVSDDEISVTITDGHIDKSAGSGIIEAEYKGITTGVQNMTSERNIDNRNMANKFRRDRSYILNSDDINYVKNEAEAIKIPSNVLQFNSGNRTGFSDYENIIKIRGDIFPDEQSAENRDLLSVRAVLAHEYYGHYKAHPSKFDIGDWRDEFNASYKAAVNAPNLSDEDRARLMIDAYDRAKEAGVSVKYNKTARRVIYGKDE